MYILSHPNPIASMESYKKPFCWCNTYYVVLECCGKVHVLDTSINNVLFNCLSLMSEIAIVVLKFMGFL